MRTFYLVTHQSSVPKNLPIIKWSIFVPLFFGGAKTRVKNIACMTVCETETVHENYGLIMKEFKRVAVPIEFCKRRAG